MRNSLNTEYWARPGEAGGEWQRKRLSQFLAAVFDTTTARVESLDDNTLQTLADAASNALEFLPPHKKLALIRYIGLDENDPATAEQLVDQLKPFGASNTTHQHKISSTLIPEAISEMSHYIPPLRDWKPIRGRSETDPYFSLGNVDQLRGASSEEYRRLLRQADLVERVLGVKCNLPPEPDHIDRIAEQLSRLTPTQQRTVRLRYGLDGGHPRTFDEIANELSFHRSQPAIELARGLEKLALFFRTAPSPEHILQYAYLLSEQHKYIVENFTATDHAVIAEHLNIAEAWVGWIYAEAKAIVSIAETPDSNFPMDTAAIQKYYGVFNPIGLTSIVYGETYVAESRQQLLADLRQLMEVLRQTSTWSLTDKQKQVLMLRYSTNSRYTHQDVGENLGTSTQNIQVCEARAIERLHRLLL